MNDKFEHEVMKTVFFYGLFMDPSLLREMGLHPMDVRIASLQGYQLRIGERATLIDIPRSRAYGTVMTLHQDELAALYAGRGVEDYVPIEVEVQLRNGNCLVAVSYVLPKILLAGSNSEYAKKLAAVARDLGLGDDYVAEIEAWV